MTNYTISIPDTLYEKARRLAQESAQPVDEVIRTHLEGALDGPLLDLPAAERDELRAMTYLSDDALFSMMREQMPRAKQMRISTLLEQNARGIITPLDHQELVSLVEDGERLTLRKATAMDILLDRGYPVRLDDMRAIDE